MMKKDLINGTGEYVSPSCCKIEIQMERAILSSSSIIEKNFMNNAPEGYDIDEDVFNW